MNLTKNKLKQNLDDTNSNPSAPATNPVGYAVLTDSDDLGNSDGMYSLPYEARQEIAVIDTTMPDYRLLVDAAEDQCMEVLLISGDSNGIEELANLLSERNNIDALHIISHGSVGQLALGQDLLTENNLDDYSKPLQVIANAITKGGDLLLYGCRTGEGEKGQAFIDELAEITGVDIAASDDLTGDAKLGGDWNLEVKTGPVYSDSQFSLMGETYPHVAALMVYEDFNGTTANQTLDGQNGWQRQGHSLATDMDIFVRNSTPLTYSGYNGGGGNYIDPVTPNTVSSYRFKLSNTSFTASSDTTFYISFLLRVSDAGDETVPTDHIVGLGNSFGGTSYEFLRIEVKDSGAGFVAGIGEGNGTGLSGNNSTAVSYGTTELNFNQTYLVLAKYSYDNGGGANADSSYIWINPSLDSEPSTVSAYATIATGALGNDVLFDGDNIDYLYLNYAATNHPEYELDAIRYSKGTTSSTAWTDLNAKLIDTTVPTFDDAPAASTITTTGFTATSSLDESGTVYYVVVADGATAPTAAEVVAGTATGGTSAFASGNAAAGTTPFDFSSAITGLKSGTAYNLYMVGKDTADNLMATATKADVTTTAATVSLSVNNATVAEAAGTSTVTATLSAAASTDTTVTIGRQSSSTATLTDDFTLSSTTITILAGNTTGTATLTAVQDTLDENDETAIIEITAVSGGGGASENGTQEATVTITDDDAAPTLSIANASLTEGNSGTSNMTFTVTLSAASGKTVTVDYATSDSTATAGSDYTAVSTTTLTFNPGETSKTFNVVITGDTTDTADETFTVTLSNPTNATIPTATATGTITNDDAAGPSITSATYDAATGALVVTGANLTNGGAIDETKLTLTGEGGSIVTLTETGAITATSTTGFTVNLNATDMAAANPILNKAGASSTSSTTYNLAGAADWHGTGNADTTGNAVNVSNVPVPTITDATYNVTTGALVVTGTGFLSNAGSTNDIDVTKLSILGDVGSYTLTSASTADVEITSATSFTVTLGATDKTAVALRLTKNGTSSNGSATYNLAAAEDWARGAESAVTVADLTGNAITASGNNTSPVIDLNGATAGTGNTVTLANAASGLASTSAAEVSDVEIGAGAWTSGGLTVQRVKTGGVADGSVNDVFSFLSGVTATGSIAKSSNSNGTLSESSTQFATWTYTSATGLLSITFDGNATTARVQTLVRNIGYANATPYGDATIRFSLSDGTTSTTADVAVTSSTITVDRTSDDDADGDAADGFSLREALARSVAQAEANTIVLGGIATGTTLTLTGTTATLGAGDTLQYSAGDSNKTLTIAGSGGGGLALAGTSSIFVANASSLTISAGISGAGSLSKTGGFALILSGANTYSGATSLSGPATLSGGSAIPDASALTVGGETILSSDETVGSLTGAGTVTLGSNTLTVGANDSNTTFSGTIQGTGGLTKSGIGTQTLSGTNTYTGATTVSDGGLTLGNGNALADTSAVTVTGSGTLTLNTDETIGTLSGAGTVTLGANALTVNQTSDTTFSGTIGGTGSLTKTGTGTLTLSGSNTTHTGTTSVLAGALSVAADSNLGTGAVTLNGGKLQVTGANTYDNDIVLAGAGEIEAVPGTGGVQATLSGIISGSGNLTKSGTTALILSGNNSYTGTTTITAGGVEVHHANGLGSTAGGTTVNSGASVGIVGVTVAEDLTITGTGLSSLGAILSTGTAAVTGAVTLSGNANVGVLSGTLTLSGAIGDGSSTFNLTKVQSGTLILSGANAYDGTTTVSAGTLSVAADANLGSGTVTLNGGTLEITGNGVTIDNAIILNTTTSVINVTSGATATLSGAISETGGSRGMNKSGSGTLVIGSNATYTGATALNGGVVELAASTTLATSAITLNNSSPTLKLTGAGTFATAIIVRGDGSISVSDAVTLSGLVSLSGTATGNRTLTKTGAGTLTLSNSGNAAASIVGSYTLGLTVSGGAVSVTDDANLPAGTVTLNGGGLTITGATTIDNVVAMSGAGTIDNANAVTLSGALSGSGALTKAGAGTLTLTSTSNSSATGTLTVTAGTVSIATDSTLVGGAVTLNGGNLTITGTDTIDNAIALSAAATIDNANAVTLSGALSGSGALTKAGAGTLTLTSTSNSSATGTLTVTAGTVSIATDSTLVGGAVTLNGGNLTITGSDTIDNAITLSAAATINNANAVILSGALSGSGALTKAGAGTLTLTGTSNSSATGTLTVTDGTVSIATDSTLVGGAVTLNGGNLTITGTDTIDNAIVLSAAATIDNANAVTLSGVLSGSGALTKAGAGTLTLSSSNTHTGTATVSAGTLLVTGSTAADSAVTALNGGTLGGTGTLTGAVTLQSGSTFAPGIAGAGTLTLSGGLTAESGSILAIDLNGTTAGAHYDQALVTGAVNVTGASLSLALNGFTPSVGDSFILISNDAGDAITGTVSVGGTLLADGATLSAGGYEFQISYVGGDGNDLVLTAVNSAPTVSSVSSGSANATYKVGDVIAVTVQFNKVVNVTGTPQLTLETGSIDRAINYTGGTGTDTLTFSYTVQAGDTSSDLDYVSLSALALNGGTIKNTIATDAILTLPTPGAAGSLGANKALVIDTTAPTAVAATVAFSADSGASASDFITKTAAQNLSGTYTGVIGDGETLQISLDNGTTWTPATTAAGGSWTLTGQTLSGSNTLKVRVTDTAGNSSAALSQAYFVDSGAPVFVSAAVNGNTLVMTYNDTLDAAHIPAAGAFTVMNGTTPITVTDVSVNAAAKTVTLTLSSAVANGDVVTVAYADPTAGDDANAIQDSSGNDAATLSVTAVTNNTPAAGGTGSIDTGGTGTSGTGTGGTNTGTNTGTGTGSGTGNTGSTETTTTTTVDGMTVTGTSKTTTETITDPTTGTEKTVTTQVVTTTVPIVPETRKEEDQTTTLADIPLAQAGNGDVTLQASLPPGVGLTSEAVTGGDHQTLRELLIAASEPRAEQSAFSSILGQGIDGYVPGVRDEAQVTVRTITFQTPPGASNQTAAPDAPPIVITGANGTGEKDPAHPDRQEALVIDVRNLPHGTVLQLNNVEFAIIIGATRVTGGDGQNFAVGDDAVQYIVLGADDDLLHGGGGDDIVGSKSGNDTLYGDDGNDLVVGGLGDDTLDGGNGDDILQGAQSDAGTWTFRIGSDGALQSNFSAGDSNLADGTSANLSGPWLTADGGRVTSDARVAFTTQAAAKLETVALLYKAVAGSLPDVYELSHWGTLDYSDSQYAQAAYDAYQAKQPALQAQAIETQVATLINNVWGASAATADWIAAGSRFIGNGGSWGEALNYLVHHDNFKGKLLNSQGELVLTQTYQSPELGWSGDSGNDQLFGGAGNDTLVGGRGRNLLDGGAGVDRAVVVENRSDYVFHVNSDGQLQINHKLRADSDILVGIESVVFGDKTQDVSASNLDGATLKSLVGLYRLETGAAPSLAELNAQAAHSVQLADVAAQLMQTPNYQSQWAGLNDSQFLAQLGTAVLGAPLTGDGQTYWLGQLANGLSREQAFIEAVGVASYQQALFGGEGAVIAS